METKEKQVWGQEQKGGKCSLYICFKDGVVDGELSWQKGRASFSASQETNRTQLLLHKPPHPAVRGPVCCCSWLQRLWESSDFDRLSPKAKKNWEEGRGSALRLGHRMTREEVDPSWFWFLHPRALTGAVLCWMAPTLKSLGKHSRRT